MREALKQEIKKIKEEMNKNVYSLKDLNLPNKKYYCDWGGCYNKPKKEEIIIYVYNDTLKLLCLKCLNDFMNEEIFDRVKIDLITEVRKVLKEGK